MVIAGLYAIVDFPVELPPGAVVDALIEGGATAIQLRSKGARLEPGVVEALGSRCARGPGVAMIINDDLELAERGLPGVAGVHLGQGDLGRLGLDPEARRARRERLRESGLGLGVSTHNLDQLRRAIAELDPDYVGFGPIFATASKPDHDPVVGLDGLARACAASPVPVVAIGGVSRDNAGELARRGAAAVASIGALMGPSPAAIRDRARTLAAAFRRIS